MRHAKTNTHSTRYWWLFGGISLVLFVVLTLGILTKAPFIHQIDFPIQQAMIHLQKASRTQNLILLSYLGSPVTNIAFTIVIAVLLWLKQHRIEAVWVLVAQGGIDVLIFVSKALVHRARPAIELVKDTSPSFPSGHTATTVTLALIILFLLVPLVHDPEIQLAISLVTIVWVAVIAFDRVYLLVHYPTDVAASVFLSIAWWSVARYLSKRYLPAIPYLRVE